MKWVICVLTGLTLMGLWTPVPATAYEIYPFNSMGPDQDLANGVQVYWQYPHGYYLFLTTEEGFQSYDFATEQWVDRTWPDWIGRALYAVVPVPGHPDRLALGGVNAWFKGVMKLSDDGGATDDLVYESNGGKVTDMALATYPDTTIFACTWSDIADGELLRSNDGGESYEIIFGHGHHAMTGVEAFTDTEIYVSGDNYITRSLDRGITWENLRGNLPEGLGIYCLLVPQPITGLPDGKADQDALDDPNIGAGFLIVSNDNGVYLSSAQVIDWQQILPFSCRAIAYRFVQYDTFIYWSEYYAVTFDGRLLICLNQDWDNWTDATEMIAPGVPVDVVSDLGPVYVATREHGVYWSSGINGASPVPPPVAGLTLAARPNPFNPVTELMFSVPQTGPAIIDIFDLAGRKVDGVFEGEVTAGPHSVSWQPRGLASGVYHAVLRQGSRRVVTRVSLIK